MSPEIRHIALADEAATTRLAGDIALAVKPGDILLLYGDLGVGKSTFARALIRALADDPELEVPSPTFTLMQEYALRLPVAHFDLYRLSEPQELVELGLEDAVDTGIALVEWPDRAEGSLAGNAIILHFADGEDTGSRRLSLAADRPTMTRLDRTLAIRAFLAHHGYGEAERRFLIGDASTRTYETVLTGRMPPPILMNAPAQPDGPPIRDGLPYSRIAHLAEDVTAFVAVSRWLREAGFSAPEIYHADLDAGLLLIENLGSGRFLSPQGEPVKTRYAVAAELLARLHAHEPPRILPVAPGIEHRVPDYDSRALLIEVELLIDWYLPHIRGRRATDDERSRYLELWRKASDLLESAEKRLVLRDYHSPNIVWREDRSGLDRIGLIDFQDALVGPSAYDVASLVQDARVTIPDEMQTDLLDHYMKNRPRDAGFDRHAFLQAYSITAAQRASKILGIFVRLDRRDGKPAYLKHLPRIEHYLAIALGHEALTELRDWYRDMGLVS